MSTIKTIRNDLARAIKLRKEENYLGAARLALNVQSAAAQSRSKHAYDLECKAHLLASISLSQAKNTDQITRSELGRIRAASKAAFQRGNTPSRFAIVASL